MLFSTIPLSPSEILDKIVCSMMCSLANMYSPPSFHAVPHKVPKKTHLDYSLLAYHGSPAIAQYSPD